MKRARKEAARLEREREGKKEREKERISMLERMALRRMRRLKSQFRLTISIWPIFRVAVMPD